MKIGVYAMNMHHGIGLEAFLGRPFPPGLAISRATIAAVADFAEAHALDSLWLGDHVIFPSRTASPHPVSGHLEGAEIRSNEPVFDPLAVLGWLGARTTRAQLGLSVLVVPYRNPVVTAKYFASLDVLTEGRLILGAGVGVIQEEFEAVGASFADRGAVTDEYLDVMRMLWTSDNPEFEGRFYKLAPGLHFLPRPINGSIPIWIGGNTRYALRRAARRGDGWLGVYLSHEELAAKSAELHDLALAEGRDPASITLALQTRFFINDEPYPAAPVGVGSVAKVVDDLGRLAQLGVQHLELALPPGPTTEAIMHQLQRYATEVRPQLSSVGVR